MHANRRVVLEISFKGEAGVGIGVTREFYAEVRAFDLSASLQRSHRPIQVAKSLALASENATVPMWMHCAPDTIASTGELVFLTPDDTNRGLFPQPFAASTPPQTRHAVTQRFRFLGRLLGKGFQVKWRVDSLPMTLTFQ